MTFKDEFADDKDTPGLSGARRGFRLNFPDLEPYDTLSVDPLAESPPGEDDIVNDERDSVEIDFESLTAAVREFYYRLNSSYKMFLGASFRRLWIEQGFYTDSEVESDHPSDTSDGMSSFSFVNIKRGFRFSLRAYTDP